ncbi:MAG: hypothetical protein J6S74_02500 [Alphaproteobacteria bacterium]|nr:hypothetical protein [Alphaproteobacteria bacterium]
MKNIRKFLLKFVAAIVIVIGVNTAIAETTPIENSNDVIIFTTDANRNAFVNNLSHDLTEFPAEYEKQIVRDYVPIEARVGIAMMNGLNTIAKILDTSLVRFMIIFMIVMYAFWIMLEAYNMMATDNNVKKLTETIVKKSIILIIWIAVLGIGPAKLFMYVMGPIISLGTYIADFILNAITMTAGITIPDTCGAIHEYAESTVPTDMIVNANTAADMLCVPTRLSGFFATAIVLGWKWMVAGIGHSIFTFVIGAVMVVMFAWNAWKFTLMAMSVIMNLFLAVLLLPFTAFAETIPQTSYKGIVGNIYNSFIKLFNGGPVKLDAQINKFINAAIYFVSLSIVIAVCAALLSGVIDVNMATHIPSLKDNGFITLLLTGALVGYLANGADKIAREISGDIKEGEIDGGTGKKFADDIKTVIKNTYDTAKSWAKAYGESKK